MPHPAAPSKLRKACQHFSSKNKRKRGYDKGKARSDDDLTSSTAGPSSASPTYFEFYAVDAHLLAHAGQVGPFGAGESSNGFPVSSQDRRKQPETATSPELLGRISDWRDLPPLPNSAPANSAGESSSDPTAALIRAMCEEDVLSSVTAWEAQQSQLDDDMALALQLQEAEEGQTEDDMALALRMQEEEEELQRQASQPKIRTCVICTDEVHPLDFPARPPTQTCRHAVHTCKACLEQWISAEMETKGWERIGCPECHEPLTHDDIRRGASAEDFEKYDRLSARAVLGGIEKFRWCIAPGCTSGQVHDEDGGPLFTCASCGFEHCVRHEVKWHKDETCEGYEYRVSGRQQRDQDEAASQTLMGKTTKKCPGQNCGWRIEKNDGCDHMTCRKCKHQFCWRCLASYESIRRDGNTAHAHSCPYHSFNIATTGAHYPH